MSSYFPLMSSTGTSSAINGSDDVPFDVSELLIFADEEGDDVQEVLTSIPPTGSGSSGGQGDEVEGKHRVVFRMKSEVDVVDDGYKWRKYGKKMIKNSSNPRNYYRCKSQGCVVKKRVERDGKMQTLLRGNTTTNSIPCINPFRQHSVNFSQLSLDLTEISSEDYWHKGNQPGIPNFLLET